MPFHPGRIARLPLCLFVAAVAVAPACGGNPKVSFEITVPSDVVDDTVWFEVGAFRDSRCVGVSPMLLNGIPEGASAHVAFRRDSPQSPALGDIDRGSYAFAAVAKNDNCGVLATGCVEVNVDKSDKISISMATTENPSGACTAGAVCEAARCLPGNDNRNPNVGAQCSLELLGAGPLPLPVGGAGTTVSAPVIAATASGFVVVYREIDSNGSSARITVLPIDPGGGALDPVAKPLKGRCVGSEETDGVGLVMNGADGQIVLGRSACGGKPGIDLLSFKSKPAIAIDANFATSDHALAQKITLSNGHVAGRGPGGNVVVYNEDGANRIETIVPGKGVSAPSGTFGSVAGNTGAWVAASDKVLAVLSSGLSSGAPPVIDAGADAATPPDPGEVPAPELALIMAPAGTSADQFSAIAKRPRLPITFPGSWGAVAALGSRVIVMSDGGDPSESVSYRAFDLDKTTSVDKNGFSVEGDGTVVTGDITMLDDKAYIAALKEGGISLHVFANASTTPRPLRDVSFRKVPRIPSVAVVRDTGRVAVAASSKRVAVAWTTAKALTNNDPTGGYAVFACTP